MIRFISLFDSLLYICDCRFLDCVFSVFEVPVGTISILWDKIMIKTYILLVETSDAVMLLEIFFPLFGLLSSMKILASNNH
jgi:hypothetical protein